MKVLVVPEQNAVAKKVSEYLHEHHNNVTSAATADDAVARATEDPHCAIVAVDEESGMDAVKLSQELRRHGADAPILVMSDSPTSERSVSVLDSGADDVIDQSAGLPEVGARLRAMSRRCHAVEGTPRQLNDLKIDVENRSVTYAGHDIVLTHREFDVLELLSRRASRLITRETIFSAVWPRDQVPNSNVLDVIVCRIRKKLQKAGATNFLQTIKGAGYRLDAPGSESDSENNPE